MKMDNDDIAELCIVLAVGIARRLTDICGSEKTRAEMELPENCVYHMHVRDFERACLVLWKVGAARLLLKGKNNFDFIAYSPEIEKHLYQQKQPPVFYEVLPSLNIISQLEGWTEKEHVTLADILSTYIAMTCNYGEDGSSMTTSRKPFQPQEEYGCEIATLIKYGFARRIANKVIWTDKICEAMQSNYFWSNDCESIDDKEIEELTIEAETAWLSMPSDLKNTLFAKEPYDILSMSSALSKRWSSELKDWVYYYSKEKNISLTGDIQLAKKIIEIAIIEKNKISITPEKRKLYIELGEFIASETIRCNGFPNAEGIYKNAFYHSSISVWEESFSFMRKLGVFYTDDNGHHRLSIQQKDIKKHLENYSENIEFLTEIEEAFTLFLGVVYETKLLPETRVLKDIPDNFLNIFLALEKAGYVKNYENFWEWQFSADPHFEANFIYLQCN